MSGLRLTLRAEPAQRLDLSPLIPDRLAGLSEAEITRLPLATTREAVSVGDVFTMRMGDVSDIAIEGGSPRFDFVGAGMTGGSVRLDGAVGLHAGRRMRGGRLAIGGDAGACAASGLRGGEMVIAGNAGPFLGAPGPGEHAGMAGGSVVVLGNAERGAAAHMRRGTIVVEGDAGPDTALGMIAGTLVICGRVSGPPGMLMRRGSILLADPVRPDARFVAGGPPGAAFLRLLALFLQPLSARAAELAARPLLRLRGDLAVGGQGEVLGSAG